MASRLHRLRSGTSAGAAADVSAARLVRGIPGEPIRWPEIPN